MLNDFLDQILIFRMKTLGGPFLVASCSQHIFFFLVLWRMERGWERRAGGEKKQLEREKKEKKMHLICSPSLCCVGFSRMGYVPSISLFLKDLPLYTED